RHFNFSQLRVDQWLAAKAALFREHPVQSFVTVAWKVIHQAAKALEQVVRIVRSGRRLGMILHREERDANSAQAFDGLVVQIQMRKVNLTRERFRVNREAMILRRDFAPPRPQVHHRMVRPMMTEAELVGPAAERETKQ